MAAKKKATKKVAKKKVAKKKTAKKVTKKKATKKRKQFAFGLWKTKTKIPACSGFFVLVDFLSKDTLYKP